MSRIKDIIRKLEILSAEKKRHEEEHPLITFLTLEKADAQRKFELIGEHCVVCDPPCSGRNYGAQTLGIEVDGAPSFGVLCNFFSSKKVCATYDIQLQEAARKKA